MPVRRVGRHLRTSSEAVTRAGSAADSWRTRGGLAAAPVGLLRCRGPTSSSVSSSIPPLKRGIALCVRVARTRDNAPILRRVWGIVPDSDVTFFLRRLHSMVLVSLFTPPFDASPSRMPLAFSAASYREQMSQSRDDDGRVIVAPSLHNSKFSTAPRFFHPLCETSPSAMGRVDRSGVTSRRPADVDAARLRISHGGGVIAPAHHRKQMRCLVAAACIALRRARGHLLSGRTGSKM